MEQERTDSDKPVQITKAVFDGLEFIRQSGITNMFDRPMVLHLAREWDFAETAEWIESVDTGTYARLIFNGPEVIGDNRASQERESDLAHREDEDDALADSDEIEVTELAWDNLRRNMDDLLATIGKKAILTVADLYEVERMGVLLAPYRRSTIAAERAALIRNLGQASALWTQLESTMSEVQRGVGSLQYMIDPENN